MQRYAGFGPATPPSSWDFLRINIPQVLNLGLSGVPDLGLRHRRVRQRAAPTAPGTDRRRRPVVGGITNYELLTRWMQVGAFLPWYRNHYNGYNKQFQEAYAYGEPVRPTAASTSSCATGCSRCIYDAMYEWTQTGVPIAPRAVPERPARPAGLRPGRPVLRRPRLPGGARQLPRSPPHTVQSTCRRGASWYAFKDNRAPLEAPVPGGGAPFDYYAPLDLVPIYIRAGAILPMRELEQYVGQLPQNPLTLNIYPGPDSTYRLYQDDGITCDAQDRGTLPRHRDQPHAASRRPDIRLRRATTNTGPPRRSTSSPCPGLATPRR